MAIQDSKRRVALLTGVTGQDGAYLAESLLGLGYTVHGVKRRSSSFNTARIDHLYEDPHAGNVPFLLHDGDMTDSTNLIRLMQQIRPTEIYNLAAQSHVGVSFESSEYTANADALGVLRLLEAIRILGMEKETRFYQASTSELYGLVQEVPQKETNPFYPRGHHNCRIRARGRQGRRIYRRDQLRPLAAGRHAAQIARRRPACQTGLARAHFAGRWHSTGLSGVFEQVETGGGVVTPPRGDKQGLTGVVEQLLMRGADMARSRVHQFLPAAVSIANA